MEEANFFKVNELKVKMIVGGGTKILKVGEGVVISPNMEHEVIPLEPNTRIMDVFYPIREEYL